MKDKYITTEIENGGDIVTVTIIPSYIYDHMLKKYVLYYTNIMKLVVAYS